MVGVTVRMGPSGVLEPDCPGPQQPPSRPECLLNLPSSLGAEGGSLACPAVHSLPTEQAASRDSSALPPTPHQPGMAVFQG